MMNKLVNIVLLVSALCACGQKNVPARNVLESEKMSLNQLAERYVKLTLAVGKHSPSYIDAYYGPQEWQQQAADKSLETLKLEVLDLVKDIDASTADNNESTRKTFLLVQTKAMVHFINQQLGQVSNFTDEAQQLYDVEVAKINEAALDAALVKLNALIPGEGDLNTRMAAFNQQFVIPHDKLSAVFDAAITEARNRTKQHVPLADNESFTIEYVTDKVWSGYNWYKGNNYSLIQMNTDFPIYISRAIDLASHEGYPGHHVFNSLMEKHLVNANGWLEYSVYPLFSPMSLLAEGSANYGIDVAFPHEERMAFEKEVLFPIAGLNAEQAERYYQVQAVMKELSYADNMIARRYLDSEIDAEQAKALLMKYTLVSAEKSGQRLRFIETNRAYVINYNLGQDLVKQYVENLAGSDKDKKWQVFADLLANPKTASMMLSSQ